MAEGIGASTNHGQWPDVGAIRRSKGITLDHIVQTTKISKRFLEAIEESDFDKLPGGIFNTSYIRQYARAIDFEEAELLAYYNHKTGVAPDPREVSPRNGNKSSSSKGLRLPMVPARF